MSDVFKNELLGELGKELGSNALHQVELVLNKILRMYDIKRIEKRTPDDKDDGIYFFMEKYFSQKLSSGMSKSTYNQYHYQIKEFIDYLGRCPSEATDDNIRNFLDYIEEKRKLSKHSKSLRRIILSSFYTWLHDNGYITINPVKLIEPVKYRSTVREGLNRKELEKCRIACGTDLRKNTMFELFYSTGCRISEILNIDIKDINWEDCIIKVLGKENKERFVIFSERASEYLKNYIGDRTSGPIFVSRKATKHPIGKQTVENEFTAIAEDAKLGRKLYPHLMRHTFAVAMIENDIPINDLSVMMGHANISTTQIYAKTTIYKMKSAHRKAIA